MGLLSLSLALGLLATSVHARYFGNYYCSEGRDVVVHLFEWKWSDIERECSWLAQNGFCAVQVSPPNEHRVITSPSYPWYQRYQPVSYKMGSRSGSEDQFKSMVDTCNNMGVYIYVDVVVNHMTGGGSGTGSDGSYWNADDENFPGVPYGPNDFNGHNECSTWNLEISDYNNPYEVRNCRLLGMRDLKGGTEYVRSKVAEYLNKLIGWGVAGFRIDASKHMWPGDIQNMMDRLDKLSTRWFPANTDAFIFSEVIDMGSEPIKGTEYTSIGRVTEFKYGFQLGSVIRKNDGQRLAYLRNFGEGWGMLNGMSAVAFLDNHDNQRGHGAGGFGSILTFFEGNMYKIANAFMLAWPYGYPRVMSSYYWDRRIVNGKDENEWMGPPSNGGTTNDVSCFNSWICEHRWRQITNMVKFHNVAVGQPVENWWDNGYQAIAFSRGNMAFIAINNEGYGINQWFNTGLPPGEYCDIISCDNNRPPCGNSGGSCRTVSVNSDRWANINIPYGEDPMVAIHV